jgi:hypothetical protein
MEQVKFVRLRVSRFAQASVFALIAVVPAGSARAAIIKDFDVIGTATNVSGGALGTCAAGATCGFSGTIAVDVTSSAEFPNGTVTGANITFPGVVRPIRFPGALNGALQGDVWRVILADDDLLAAGDPNAILALEFTTGRTPASLVGFNGGTITGSNLRLRQENIGTETIAFANLSGDIAVPEPSSLALLCSGLIGLAGMAGRKLKTTSDGLRAVPRQSL